MIEYLAIEELSATELRALIAYPETPVELRIDAQCRLINMWLRGII